MLLSDRYYLVVAINTLSNNLAKLKKIKFFFFLTFIALVGMMTLTLQYIIVSINTKEKRNYVGEKERIFYLSNNYFPAVGRQ